MHWNYWVSFETSFDSKQPKLEPKLVSALSETKRLFRLFRFYAETEIFDVSIEPKQTEDQPKQFKREYIWVFFRKFRVHLLTFLEMLSIYVFLWVKISLHRYKYIPNFLSWIPDNLVKFKKFE